MKLKIVLIVVLLISMSILVSWLYQNSFFLGYDSSDFNNLLTPIITIITIVLLIWTLSETKNFNKNQLALNEYNILLQDFELIKLRLESLHFDINKSLFTDSLINDLDKTNGISYCTFLLQFIELEMRDEKTDEKRLIEFRNKVIYPLVQNYRNLEVFLVDVHSNKMLSNNYQIKFYKKVEQLLLQDYFRVCNNIVLTGVPVYKLDVFDFNKVFDVNDFNRINNFYLKHKLFYLHVEKSKFYELNT